MSLPATHEPSLHLKLRSQSRLDEHSALVELVELVVVVGVPPGVEVWLVVLEVWLVVLEGWLLVLEEWLVVLEG